MAYRARLTIFHGGSADRVMRQSAELTAKAAEELGPDERAIYINTLRSDEEAEHVIRKACRRHGGAETRRKILVMTVPTDDLITHEDFVQKMIETRNIQLAVLNSFDFAAMFGRRRMRLVGLLLRLRDFLKVDVAVGFRLDPQPQTLGAVGSLVYQAQLSAPLEQLADFWPAAPQSIEEDTEDASQDDEFDMEFGIEDAPLEDDDELENEFRIVLWQAPSRGPLRPSDEAMRNRSLETNDLKPLKRRTLAQLLREVPAE